MCVCIYVYVCGYTNVNIYFNIVDFARENQLRVARPCAVPNGSTSFTPRGDFPGNRNQQ